MNGSRPPRRRATLRDIAESVGVDVSTVSKVLNASSGISVRPETRARILDEVARVGYHPNAAARSLKMHKTGALGMVFPDFANPVYATMIRGAVRQAEALGYVMLLTELRDDDPAPLARLVLERRIDGLIIATAQDATGMLAPGAEVPYVYVNRRVPGARRSVTVDDGAAGRLAAQTLIDAGHRRLAFVGAPDAIDTARRRRAGFMETALSAGLPAPVDIVQPYSRHGGYDAAEALSGWDPRPTGVFASNLLVGRGLLAGLRAQDLRVPDDVSLVSLEDEDAAFTAPPLTTVGLPFFELGTRSVKELHRLLEGKRPRDQVVLEPVEVHSRASVGPPPE